LFVGGTLNCYSDESRDGYNALIYTAGQVCKYAELFDFSYLIELNY